MRDGIRRSWEHGFFDVMRRRLATATHNLLNLHSHWNANTA